MSVIRSRHDLQRFLMFFNLCDVGMRLFSKYSPRDVPEVILYDEEKRILVSEWLERYVPLRNFFDLSLPSNSRDIAAQYLEVDSDTCRAMGTIMGRSHARTHR